MDASFEIEGIPSWTQFDFDQDLIALDMDFFEEDDFSLILERYGMTEDDFSF